MPDAPNQPTSPDPGRAPRAPRGAHAASRVIAFMNQKGGVGKTTSVVNIAAGIAQRGRSVLLVDMDPQAHSTISLGVDPAAQQASVYDVLLDPAFDALDALSVGARPHLAVLGSEVDLAAAETELAGVEDRNQRLARALEPLKSVYEYILIDCPPSLGVLTLNALAAAREVIMPMQAHFLALQGVSKLLETVSLVSQGVNPRLKVSGVVLCMHDENTRHAREVVADLEQFFEQGRQSGAPWWAARVYRPAVRRSIKLAESPGFGQTIFEYAPGSTGALDYQALADELIAEWDALTRPPQGAAAPHVVVRHPGKPKPARAGG
ncbi:MAG: ParA family protein [Planctomycetes bacterium]|nr:ParA family protein [Planctomycetota bacterium]